MSILKVKDYGFDKENRMAFFSYTYKGKVLTGGAICHKDDEDFLSEKLGISLAESRAYREYLIARRDELAIRKQTLVSAMNNMIGADMTFEVSSHKDVLQAMIRDTDKELKEYREAIVETREMIDQNIKARDELYKKIRSRRAKELEEAK